MPDIRIEFVSSAVIGSMQSNERIRYLLKVIRKGAIIVLEERLQFDEEKELIQETMGMINDRFTGIEISSLGGKTEGWKNAVIRALGGRTSGLTVIGPAKIIKAIRNDKEKINLLAGFGMD